MISTLHCYWVYILASQPRGTLYIGVTNNILGRIEVWFEEFSDIQEAIQREKSLKRYLRAWKIKLIEQSNPQWVDLYPGLVTRFG